MTNPSTSSPTTGSESSKKRFFRKLAINLLIIIGLFFGIRTCQKQNLASETADPVIGMSIQGDKIVLSDYKGQPVLLHFWATWCGVCETMSPNLEKVSKDYKVITVASQSGSVSEIQAYLAKNQLTTTTVVDPEGRLSQSYGVNAFPTSFIIDKEGEVLFSEVGYTTEIGLRLRMYFAGR